MKRKKNAETPASDKEAVIVSPLPETILTAIVIAVVLKAIGLKNRLCGS